MKAPFEIPKTSIISRFREHFPRGQTPKLHTCGTYQKRDYPFYRFCDNRGYSISISQIKNRSHFYKQEFFFIFSVQFEFFYLSTAIVVARLHKRIAPSLHELHLPTLIVPHVSDACSDGGKKIPEVLGESGDAVAAYLAGGNPCMRRPVPVSVIVFFAPCILSPTNGTAFEHSRMPPRGTIEIARFVFFPFTYERPTYVEVLFLHIIIVDAIQKHQAAAD